MTHDPMCDDHHDGGDCPWCNFAARVRKDERGKGEWPRWATAEIRRNALRDAVEAVKALLDESLEVWNCPGGTSDEDNGHYCFGADGCRHTGYRQAVAAIEALGGQS